MGGIQITLEGGGGTGILRTAGLWTEGLQQDVRRGTKRDFAGSRKYV